MRILICVLAVSLALPGGLAAVEDLTFERDEPAANDHASRGQHTCVAEASVGGDADARCPVALTGSLSPLVGVMILDAYAGIPAGISDLRTISLDNAGTGSAAALTRESPRSMSLQRTFLPAGPDVILPGPTAYRAWFGHWSDLDGDFTIDIVYDAQGYARGPGNEWVPAPGYKRTLVAYVEPGSHPSPADLDRPDESMPDFDYEVAGVVWRGNTAAPGEIKSFDLGPIFLDGSLFQRYEIVTVSDALLAPGARFPFTPGPQSLVDIDAYAAVAPGSVQDLYMSAAPLVNAVGSPGLSACPNTCRTGPVPLGDSPAADLAGPVEGLVWAPYPQESRPGEEASSSGLHANHLDGYAPWIDLLPGHHDSIYFERHIKGSNVPFGPGPLRGRDAEGRQAMAPGLMGFTAHVGLWMDRNADGWVGVASTPDPNERGSRPLGDRYDRPAGEFVGATATDAKGVAQSIITVTVTPVADWGPNGVYLCALTVSSTVCLTTEARHYTGATPITLTVSEDPTTRGHYASTNAILFPEGSVHGGVVACIQGAHVSHVSEGVPTVSPVRDCDRVGRYSIA